LRQRIIICGNGKQLRQQQHIYGNGNIGEAAETYCGSGNGTQ
jgi:hypothetical protein